MAFLASYCTYQHRRGRGGVISREGNAYVSQALGLEGILLRILLVVVAEQVNVVVLLCGGSGSGGSGGSGSGGSLNSLEEWSHMIYTPKIRAKTHSPEVRELTLASSAEMVT